MTIRNLSPATQRSYVHAVAKFSRYCGRSPDRLDLEDVRAFQVHLVSTGISWPALNQTVCALRFFFGVTLGHAEIPADDILSLCAPEANKAEVTAAIDELVNRAILIRQSRLGGYALFAGSDFDLDEAISKVAFKLDADVLADLPSRLGVGPIAAKSHYFSTGALRTFDVIVQFADESPQSPAAWAKKTAASLAKADARAPRSIPRS